MGAVIESRFFRLAQAYLHAPAMEDRQVALGAMLDLAMGPDSAEATAARMFSADTMGVSLTWEYGSYTATLSRPIPVYREGEVVVLRPGQQAGAPADIVATGGQRRPSPMPSDAPRQGEEARLALAVRKLDGKAPPESRAEAFEAMMWLATTAASQKMREAACAELAKHGVRLLPAGSQAESGAAQPIRKTRSPRRGKTRG
ncbi:hypothetical protein JYK14_05815 [Siccirubricoccus sp. KC 17139]|uniref:Uncharacterized protein n=1 Tax=Siccirubricoccus soli TaxID=2899147 RepID=A0ABT1D3B0_9PROT|nr:hypothetical protein [Siccirubricoccus soli]MCO6415694.1 hypothetical protein [Siccirubricoccus soli]MCP2681826.1 hypothetical protein [Siccirubricoccus soli]